eukprot:g6157.t1
MSRQSSPLVDVERVGSPSHSQLLGEREGRGDKRLRSLSLTNLSNASSLTQSNNSAFRVANSTSSPLHDVDSNRNSDERYRFLNMKGDTTGVIVKPMKKKHKSTHNVSTLTELISLLAKSDSNVILVQCARALRQLGRLGPNYKRRIGLYGGISALLRVLRTSENLAVVEAATCSLRSLSCNVANRISITKEQGAFAILVELLSLPFLNNFSEKESKSKKKLSKIAPVFQNQKSLEQINEETFLLVLEHAASCIGNVVAADDENKRIVRESGKSRYRASKSCSK